MKKLVSASALAMLMSTAAQSENLGITMGTFDDNFMTLVRTAMLARADEIGGIEVQVEDAQNDVGKQLNQIQNFVASGVDAIIVTPADTDATVAMSNAAEQGGIPLVYVNREPVNIDTLPDNQAFVASDEIEAGRLQAQRACALLKEQGKTDGAKVVVIMGDLAHQASRLRTQGVEDVAATGECGFMEVVEKQTAMWWRTPAADLMTNWLTASVAFDAVLANNDEMAIGAIQALKAAGMPMEDVIVGGIDATADAVAAMKAGDLDITVFQNAAGQAHGAVDAAMALAGGEDVEQKVYIPFELVTPANVDSYAAVN
ncbi:sugar ABC transporter substrate-binding protein [Tropicimonas sp.]|uniref:sugar ABC transporter substrate-binding protein n=1 Tax=Tropicimonas sp. TaxID=2067044 RepID=UPI003A8B39F7